MKVYEAIVDRLAGEGVDTVFTLASEEIISTLSHLRDDRGEEFRVVDCRHEQGAALMADGYGRAGGGIGVCIVGRGPAIAQTGTALLAANRSGSDVLYLVPSTRRTTAHDGKGFEQEAFLGLTAGTVEVARSVETVPAAIDEALRELRAGRGPVAVQLPVDVLEGELAVDDIEVPAAGVDDQEARLAPADAAVEAAIDAYLDSDATKAPVILAGRGAIAADAKAAIERLAERMNAYLATSIQAWGYFADHPYYLGFAGDLGTNVANEHLIESDYVLAIGCSLNHHTVDSGELLRDEAKVVHVDTDPTHIGRFTPVDVGIVGDASVTADALYDRLEAMGIDRSGEFWTERVRDRIATSSPASDRVFEERPGTVDPRDLVSALDEVLPAGRLVVSDVGHFGGWVFDGLRIGPDDRHVWAADFLALGQGLPMAVGAALAETDRTVISFCGDGGLMMIVQELETAARYGVPLIVVVMNDNALGAEYHMAKLRGFSGSVGPVDAPDFAALAEVLGATGHTVRSVDDLHDLEDALAGTLDGPLVLDCQLNPEASHRTMGNLSIE